MAYPNQCRLCLSLLFLLLSFIPFLKKVFLSAAVLFLQLLSILVCPTVLCLLCQPGRYAPEGSPHWRGDNTTANHANITCSAYAYLMPLWALAYICPAPSSSCQAIRASFMIPCLSLSTCHMEVQQNTWVLSQQLLCCDLATTACSSRHWALKGPCASVGFMAVPSVRL